MKCEICKQPLDSANDVSSSPSGVIGGKHRYCQYCYHTQVLKLSDPPSEMVAAMSDCLRNLTPTERKRLVDHLQGRKRLLVGPGYRRCHAAYEGVPSLAAVAAGTKIKRAETRQMLNATEQRITEKLAYGKDGYINMYGYLVCWMTPAQVRQSCETKSTKKRAKARKKAVKSVLDDLF